MSSFWSSHSQAPTPGTGTASSAPLATSSTPQAPLKPSTTPPKPPQPPQSTQSSPPSPAQASPLTPPPATSEIEDFGEWYQARHELMKLIGQRISDRVSEADRDI
jgi:hypothetical protein